MSYLSTEPRCTVHVAVCCSMTHDTEPRCTVLQRVAVCCMSHTSVESFLYVTYVNSEPIFGHVTRMKEACHRYEGVMSHTSLCSAPIVAAIAFTTLTGTPSLPPPHLPPSSAHDGQLLCVEALVPFFENWRGAGGGAIDTKQLTQDSHTRLALSHVT